MIPLRDSVRPRRRAVVNTSLIVLNLLVFAYEATLTREELLQLFDRYAVVPVRYTLLASGLPVPGAAGGVLPLFTSVFLHGGLFHVLGNMLFLWVFGDNVEDKLGRVRYLGFYLLSGVVGGLAHVIANPGSALPTVGASGAVAGVLGAYFLIFPRARVLALLPLVIFWTITEVPAVFFLALWFIVQLVRAWSAAAGGVQVADTVAWWAHVGGFVTGMVYVSLTGIRARYRW